MAEEQGEEAPKKKKPILLIVLVVNVLLGGGAGAFFFMRGNAAAEGAAPPAEGGHAEEPAADVSVEGGGKAANLSAPLIEFQPIVVNLNEPEGARYLKIGLTVQLANESLVEPVENAKPIVRDHFIRELSDLNFRQTMGNKNKLSLKRRLIKRFNEALGTDGAIDIHITQFVVQ